MPNYFNQGSGMLRTAAARLALKSYRGGLPGAGMQVGMHGLLGLSAYAGALGRGSPTAWGAAAGMGWGMASDDTSVIGGGLIGAGLGRYGGAGGRLAYRASSMTPVVGSLGFGGGAAAFGRGMWSQGKADWRGVWTNGVASKGFIGRTQNRAVNGWRSLWQ